MHKYILVFGYFLVVFPFWLSKVTLQFVKFIYIQGGNIHVNLRKIQQIFLVLPYKSVVNVNLYIYIGSSAKFTIDAI